MLDEVAAAVGEFDGGVVVGVGEEDGEVIVGNRVVVGAFL